MNKHNKKRNPAILYNVLIKEMARCVILKETSRHDEILNVVKEHFDPSSPLGKEYRLYKEILNAKGSDRSHLNKLIYEVRREFGNLEQRALNEQKNGLIAYINKNLGKEVYSNFVPQYKNLATIYQILDDKSKISTKLALQESLVNSLTQTAADEMQPIDNLVYKTFVDKFNEHYTGLLNEQKTLLNKYLRSESFEDLELRVYVHKEIGRIKEALSKNENESLKGVIEVLEESRTKKIDMSLLEIVLQAQELVNELGK